MSHDDLEPVLTSFGIITFDENVQFQTFCTNLTHFYYDFLKDFYIFRISGSSGSFGTNGSRIHPVLAEKNIASRKWLYQFDFYCIVISVIH